MALGKGIPVINGFDLNSKLPLDSRAVADTKEEMNKLVTDGSVGDGQLCYCKADKKMYVLKDNVWSEVGGGGGSIPVVEGTIGEASGGGDIATLTIPNVQTNNFILHIADMNANVYMQYFDEIFCGSIPVSNIVTYIFIIFGTQGLIYTSSYIERIEIMSNIDPITFTSAGCFSRGSDNILYSIINKNLVTPLYPSLEDTNKYTYYYTDKNKILQEKQVQLEETKTATLFNKYKIKIPKGTEYNDVILPFNTLDNEDDGKVLTIVNKQVQWASAGGSGSISVTFED